MKKRVLALLVLPMSAACMPPWVSQSELDKAQAESSRLRIELDTARKRHVVDTDRLAAIMTELGEARASSRAHDTPHTVFVEVPPSTAPQAPEPIQEQHGSWHLVGRWGIEREPGCSVAVLVSFEGEAGFQGSGPGQAIRTPFVKMEYSSKPACPQEAFSSITSRLQLGCKASTQRTLASRAIDWGGESHALPPDVSVQPVYPDTLMHEAWQFSCTQK